MKKTNLGIINSALKLIVAFALLGLSVSIVQAQADPNIDGIILNQSGDSIDVYVVVPPSDDYPQESSELLHTVPAGQQVSDKFLLGEVILITRSGGDDVLEKFTHDGTANKVFVVQGGAPVTAQASSSRRGATTSTTGTTAQEVATSSNSGACPRNAVNCDAWNNSQQGEGKSEEAPTEPVAKVIISDDFKQWLQTDKTTYSKKGRTIDQSEVKNAFQNQWLLEDDVRHGYNALKMNPGDLTDHGLHSPPNIFDKIGKDSKTWHWDKYKIALANDLVLHKAEESFGEETTTMSFTSYEELDSESTSIGLGAEFQGKGSKGASTKNGNGVKGKIGWGRDQGKMEANGETLIRKQQVGRAYWACYVKEHMRLDAEFSDYLLNKNNLKTYAQFKNFFEEYGTHWPLCTYFGGWIKYEERMSNTELAEHVKDSFSVGVEAKVPAGKAPVAITGSLDYSKTDETRSKNNTSNSSASWKSKGGTLGASIGMWQMQEPQNASSYIPVQLELRQMNEIIWPELMGITDADQANHVHDLRKRMTTMLDQYFTEAQGQTTQYDWSPRLYELKLEKVVVTKDDDKGFFNVPTTPSFFGNIFIGEGIDVLKVDGVPLGFKEKQNVWSVSEDDVFTAKKLKQFKLEDKTVLISVPTKPVVDKKIAGKTFYKPEWDYGNQVAYINMMVFEDDDPAVGGDDLFMQHIRIKLQDVESKPNKILKVNKEFEAEDVELTVHYQVKRVDYDFDQSPSTTAARPPKLKRQGEGAAVAARGAKVSAPVVAVSTTPTRAFPETYRRPGSGGSRTSTSTASSNTAEQACFDQVQGKVAWHTNGSNSWSASNVQALCKGVSQNAIKQRIDCFKSRMPSDGWSVATNTCVSGASATAGSSSASAEQTCYQRVQGKVAWSTQGDKSWSASNVQKLCKGVSSNLIDARIGCFSGLMPSQGWSQAINSCQL